MEKSEWQINIVIHIESFSMLVQINGNNVFLLTFQMQHLLFRCFLALIFEFWNPFMQLFSGIAIGYETYLISSLFITYKWAPCCTDLSKIEPKCAFSHLG